MPVLFKHKKRGLMLTYRGSAKPSQTTRKAHVCTRALDFLVPVCLKKLQIPISQEQKLTPFILFYNYFIFIFLHKIDISPL